LKDTNKGCKGLITWFISLFVLAAICLSTMVIAADMICKSNVEQWLPYYPNAEVVSIEHDFLRARAMGETWVTLASPDDAETVRQFYRDHTIAVMREGTLRGWAITDWHVDSNPDGNGSIIRLYSTCGE
jgi:hypothetical protein